MVQNKPYVHFKIINEKDIDDYTADYLWATTVEATKGPIFEPTVVTSATDAEDIFGIDVAPFFANGGRALCIVRVGAEDDNNTFEKGSYSIKLQEDFKFRVLEDAYFGDSVEPSDDPQVINNSNPVEITPFNYTENPTYSDVEAVQTERAKYGNKKLTYITIDDEKKKVAKKDGKWAIVSEVATDGLKFYDDMSETDEGYTDAVKYMNVNISDSQVLYKKIIVEYKVKALTPIIDFVAKFPGTYDVEIGCTASISVPGAYNITVSEEGKKSILLKNLSSLTKITDRVNERNYNITASLTEAGKTIAKVMESRVYDIPTSASVLDNTYKVGDIIKEEQPYAFVLEYISHALEGGSNGLWRDGRIPESEQNAAHAAGLRYLENIRLSGLFCTYEEERVKLAYVAHTELMNDEEVCKWRQLVLGASANDRNYSSLISNAIALNNQYIMFLGQGLVDSGIPVSPCAATQYVAGLRSKLFYGDAIFGGESKKEIKPAYGGKLTIAPLYEDDTSLVWRPEDYVSLNESGVMTFTEDYGHISLTDGVTTIQDPLEEDEEGVISILKYAQNHVYDICVRHIGKNITQDTENALKMQIVSFLGDMKNIDQTLIALPSEGLNAYEVDININPRKNQLVGKIQVFIKITPVHALRQIEVEMTVQ